MGRGPVLPQEAGVSSYKEKTVIEQLEHFCQWRIARGKRYYENSGNERSYGKKNDAVVS
jgi:hypothetical protein